MRREERPGPWDQEARLLVPAVTSWFPASVFPMVKEPVSTQWPCSGHLCPGSEGGVTVWADAWREQMPRCHLGKPLCWGFLPSQGRPVGTLPGSTCSVCQGLAGARAPLCAPTQWQERLCLELGALAPHPGEPWSPYCSEATTFQPGLWGELARQAASPGLRGHGQGKGPGAVVAE